MDKLSPQRRYQKDHAERGLCRYCSSPAVVVNGVPSSTCADHNLRRKRRARKASQSRAWHQGGPGRPPVVR